MDSVTVTLKQADTLALLIGNHGGPITLSARDDDVLEAVFAVERYAIASDGHLLPNPSDRQ